MKKSFYLIISLSILFGCSSDKEPYKDLWELKSKYAEILPTGQGRTIDFSKIKNYRTFCLVKNSQDSLLLFYNDSLISFEEFYIEYNKELHSSMSFLFIDRSIKFKSIERLFDMLQGFCMNRTCIVMNNKNEQTNLKGISIYLPRNENLRFKPPIPQLPPTPPLPDFVSIMNKNSVCQLRNDSIFLNGEYLTDEDFKTLFLSTNQEDPRKYWAYYMDPNSTLQSLVSFYDMCYTEYYKERDFKANDLYGTEFLNLNDSLKKEIRRRVPVLVKRVTESEYKRIKEKPEIKIVDDN